MRPKLSVKGDLVAAPATEPKLDLVAAPVAGPASTSPKKLSYVEMVLDALSSGEQRSMQAIKLHVKANFGATIKDHWIRMAVQRLAGAGVLVQKRLSYKLVANPLARRNKKVVTKGRPKKKVVTNGRPKKKTVTEGRHNKKLVTKGRTASKIGGRSASKIQGRSASKVKARSASKVAIKGRSKVAKVPGRGK